MTSFHLILVSLALLCCYQVSPTELIKEPLRIGAWNVQELGTTKMENPAVVGVIVDVMRRFDIIAILEVRDEDGEVSRALKNKLNEGLAAEKYELVLSEQVGAGTHLERYAVYYKTSAVTGVETYQYDDSAWDEKDKILYKPFIVIFEGNFHRRLSKFGFIPIHTAPNKAVSEINALAKVYDSFKVSTGIEDVIIAGDFNAGGQYVKESDYDKIALWTRRDFTWLISNHIDTTVISTSPYDRIVIAGYKMKRAVYAQTAKPYYFDEEKSFLDYKIEAEQVSDHYPVEILIRRALGNMANRVFPSVSLSVTFSTSEEAISDFASKVLKDPNVPHVIVSAFEYSKNEAKDGLTAWNTKHPLILPIEGLETLLYKFDNGGLEDSSLYGDDEDQEQYKVEVACNRRTSLCVTSLSRHVAII